MVGDGAGDRVADRLAAARAAALVGRSRERAHLAELLARRRVAVFVHGPGGIGKSLLVAAVVQERGLQAVTLDARDIEPTPGRVLAALGAALGEPAGDLDALAWAWRRSGQHVLVLDAYERFAVVDGWVRNELLPRLPGTTSTVLVGRNPPNIAWRASPGWRHLIAEVLVGPLAGADAAALVARREARPEIAAKIVHFGRGHPLALELAIDAFARHPDLQLHDGPPPEVVEELLDVLLDDLSPSARRIAEAVSILRRVTTPLLSAVLGADEDDPPGSAELDAAWRVVRDLPFSSVRPGGLELNGIVQLVVATGVELREPGRARQLRRRAARAALTELRRAPGWDATADLLHLIQNPVVRNAFLPPPGLQHPVEDARPDDGDAVLAIVEAADGAAHAALLAKWWARDPAAFRVRRGSAGEVRAFSVVRRADEIPPALTAEDPVAAAVITDLASRPLPDGACALLLRRALALPDGEALSAALAPMIVDVKRVYLELRPALQRVYAVVTGWSERATAMRAMGFEPLALDVGVEPPVVLCALEFGPGSVDEWLARHVELETTAVPAPPEAAGPGVRSADGAADGVPAALGQLSAREREVLAALAEGLTNRELAERLFISERTANRHLSNIFTKLGVHNRTAAARLAVTAGLA